jgi:hypothetical protein
MTGVELQNGPAEIRLGETSDRGSRWTDLYKRGSQQKD